VRLGGDGVYPFFCYTHPGMVAVVVAGDGRGVGTGVVQVADSQPAPAAAAQPAPAAATQPAPAGRQTGTFPVAWLVLVALAALVGAAAGTRIRSRGPA
jgi:hypothetical protein